MTDRLFGLVALFTGLTYVFAATRIPTGFLVDPVGPKTFPMLVGGIGALCGLLIALKPDRPGPQWPTLRTALALLLAVIVLVGYAYALKPLGFLLPTAVAAGVLSYQIHPRPLAALFTGVALSGGLFLLFKYVLGLGLFALPRSF